MFGQDNIEKGDDKLFFYSEKFYAEDFNHFRKRVEIFLVFIEHFEDEESKTLKLKVSNFINDKITHRRLLIRMAWGDSSENIISYTDDKPNPDYDDALEEELINLDSLMREYLNKQIKILYPNRSIDLTRVSL